MVARLPHHVLGKAVKALLLLSSGSLAACSPPADRDATSTLGAYNGGAGTVETVRGGCSSNAPPRADRMPFPKTSIPAGSGDWQAVGFLTNEDSDGKVVGACSGTLVGTEASIAANVASVVLTAKHCRNGFLVKNGQTMNFYIGAGSPYPVSKLPTREMLIASGMRWYASTDQVSLGRGTFEEFESTQARVLFDDLALVYLNYDVEGVKPLLLQPPASRQNGFPEGLEQSSIQIVGFGTREDRTVGVKWMLPFELSLTVKYEIENQNWRDVTASHDIYNSEGLVPNLDEGDSGGPFVANLPNVGVRVLAAIKSNLRFTTFFQRTDTTAIYNEIESALTARANGPRRPSYGNSCPTSEATTAGASGGTSPTDPATVGIRGRAVF